MKLSIFFILFLILFSFSGKEGEEVIFYEEFGGITLNEHYWNYELGDGCPNLCGWGNNEPQIYTRENALLDGDNLKIKATYEDGVYKSARLTTKGKIEFQYGTVEVRAKLPKGKGVWPAIWMLGNDIDTNIWPACGEIDIMEYVGRKPGIIYTSLHTPASFGETINSKQTYFEDIEESYHVYKTTWSHKNIQFFVDDFLVYTYEPQEKNEKTWPFNKPFYLIINMAVGGNFGGPEVDNSIFPAEFLIDYIKVYQ